MFHLHTSRNKFYFDIGFPNYNPKDLFSSLLAYETVLNTAYHDEIVGL